MKKRTTITIHPDLYEKAQQLMAGAHFSDFSTFVEHLIREEGRNTLALKEEFNSTARALADEAADDALRAAHKQTQGAAPVHYSKPTKRRR